MTIFSWGMSYDNFARPPWIEERANEFLERAAERPEELHFPEWLANFEKPVKTRKD